MPIKVYTTIELAKILRVHPTLIVRLIKNRKIAATKIGREYRITEPAVEKYLGQKLEKKYYSVSDLAKIFQLHRDYIGRLIAAKKLNPVKIGKIYRISQSEVTRLAQDREPRFFYTIADVTKILKVKRLTILKFIAEQKLAAIKIGKFYRIAKQDFKAFTGQEVSGQLYTLEEIAKGLKVNINTIRKQVKENRLAAIKIGRQYRVSEVDLAAFLDKAKQGR